MSTLHTEREAPEEEFQNMSRRNDPEQDREISLNTSTILLIFFALALVCSAFFGFGYTMGRKSTPPTTYAASEDHTQSLRDAFKSFKPAPGGPATKTSPAPAPSPTPEDTESAPSVAVPTAISKTALPPTKKAFDPDAEIVTQAPTPKAAPATHSTPVAPATATTQPAAPTGTVIVQVAAVSHQEDADTMLSALKRKGYSVSIRQEPQDRLLHLQLGPYASKKDAEAMRARLLADGYNSILK
jgi:septal ring-binding cell division protein DamX